MSILDTFETLGHSMNNVNVNRELLNVSVYFSLLLFTLLLDIYRSVTFIVDIYHYYLLFKDSSFNYTEPVEANNASKY